jgi:hypothetical protein
MQPKAYGEGKDVGDLKENTFKTYFVQIRRIAGNLGEVLFQSIPKMQNGDPSTILFL